MSSDPIRHALKSYDLDLPLCPSDNMAFSHDSSRQGQFAVHGIVISSIARSEPDLPLKRQQH